MTPDEKSGTLETDEFIYPDQVLEAMDYSLQECNECKSRDIKSLELVSHSMSNDTLTALFDTISDFEVLVDVGSRSGCVLYAAYLMTGAKNIIGIEIDKDWCTLQNNILKTFQFQGN